LRLCYALYPGPPVYTPAFVSRGPGRGRRAARVYLAGLGRPGAARIDHGIRCVGDPGLVRRLREEQIPLTVCPLSNVRLRAVDSMEEHPLKRMLGEGLCVTVNSDDPAYFGGYVADNYSAVRDGLGFSREEFRAVAENSFKASFLGEKKRLLEELGSYLGT
jgi:adenosine deaminase